MNNDASDGTAGPSLVSTPNILAATQSLLRTLVVLMQGLPPLPSSAIVVMNATYYDSAPQDYEPQGFFACNYNEIEDLGAGSGSIRVGEVGSKHHRVLLEVKAPSAEEPTALVSSQQPVGVQDRYGFSESESDAQRIEAPVQDDGVSEAMENVQIKENTVDCVCLLNNSAGQLLVCSICGKSSHGACYRVLDDDIPTHHCLDCSSSNDLTCTDPKLPKMA